MVSRAVRGTTPALAAVVMISCSVSGADFDRPWHDTTRDYLRAVAAGRPATAFHGACDGAREEDTRRVVAGEGADFTFSFVNSTREDDLATVNVSITGADHSPSPYSVDLRQEHGKWMVCHLAPGNIAIDAGLPGDAPIG